MALRGINPSRGSVSAASENFEAMRGVTEKKGRSPAAQLPVHLHRAKKAGKRKHVRNVSLTRYTWLFWVAGRDRDASEVRWVGELRCELATEFRPHGAEFISLDEGVDTSTPNGRLVFRHFLHNRPV